MILVAAQTPKEKTGYAIGILSGGIMAGNIVGPLAGGMLPAIIGIRETFLLTGGIIFLAFLGTLLLLKEERQPARHSPSQSAVQQPVPVAVKVMWVSAMLLIFATMSVEPIITLYVASLISDLTQATLFTGVIMASTALGSIIAAPRIGALADRTGHWRVLCCGLLICGVLLIPQAFVTAVWQLLVLRFLMGLALGECCPVLLQLSAIMHRPDKPVAYSGIPRRHNISVRSAGHCLAVWSQVRQVCRPFFWGRR